MKNDPRSPVCCKPAGGVRDVALTSPDNILHAEFDGTGDRCEEPEFARGQEVMYCRLLEERSSRVETLETEGNARTVRHRLTLTADRNLAEEWLSKRFADELLAHGAVAVVTLGDGRRFLAGVSQRFGCAQPLRLVRCSADSGRRCADTPTVQLVLESIDTAFAAQIENG